MISLKVITKKIIIISLIAFISFSIGVVKSSICYGATSTHQEYTDQNLMDIVQGIIKWRKKDLGLKEDQKIMNKILSLKENETFDWFAFAMGRWGYEDAFESYAQSDESIAQSMLIADSYAYKATDLYRTALTLLSLGADPTELNYQNRNLIEEEIWSQTARSAINNQGLNAVIWALITVDSFQYVQPEQSVVTRDDLIEEILSAQMEDFGFSLDMESSNVDITAMAIIALAPYYNSGDCFEYKDQNGHHRTTTIREAVDHALDYLSSVQSSDGDFSSWNTLNVESTAQVLTAISALGIDPLTDTRFIKNGYTILDGIMKYRHYNGGFIHSYDYDEQNAKAVPGESNYMASEQVLYGLNAYYRSKNNLRCLFDFRPEMDQDITVKVQTVKAAIDSLTEESDKELLEHIYNLYLQIQGSERRYVYNYYHLSDYMRKNGMTPTESISTKDMSLHTSGSGYVNWLFENYKEDIIIFSANDIATYLQIDPEYGTRDYTKASLLLSRLEQAVNKKEYEDVHQSLNETIKEMEYTQKVIAQINQDSGKYMSYSLSEQIEYEENLQQILHDCQQLTNYDREHIEDYQQLQEINLQLRNRRKKKMLLKLLLLNLLMLLAYIGSFTSVGKNSRQNS